MDKENLIGKLYQQHYKQLFIFGLQFASEPHAVKDAINDVFLGLCESPNYLHQAKDPIAYLSICVRNRILKTKKIANKQNTISNLTADSVTMSAADENLVIQQLEELWQRVAVAVSKLSARQKEIIQLKYYDAKKTADIEVITGMSTKTVYNTLSSALKNLKAEVKYGLIGALSYFLF